MTEKEERCAGSCSVWTFELTLLAVAFFTLAVALCLPILFLPTYLLYNQWRKHYVHVELYMLVKLYATAFIPGALVVMLVESLVTLFFFALCFQSSINTFLNPAPGQTPAPTDPNTATGGNPDGGQGQQQQAPAGMEFLNFKESPALFIFLFLLSYGSAGCVEESLKCQWQHSVHTACGI